MKEIYKLFNEMDIDVKEFEEIDVSDTEKALVKKHLKSTITPKTRHWKKPIIAASITLSLASATLLSAAFSSEAGAFLGNLFNFFNQNGVYEDYKENSDEINHTQESKGITITVNDAIFDGKNVHLTYTIESELDLGEEPNIHYPYLEVKNQHIGQAQAGSNKISRVDLNQYVGMMTINIDGAKSELSNLTAEWNIESIVADTEEENEIQGEWSFEFDLNAIENMSEIVLNESREKQGVAVDFQTLQIKPMAIKINYEQIISESTQTNWDFVQVKLDIKDDLGNEYTLEDNYGSGSTKNKMSFHETYNKLNEKASKLVITPTVELSEADEVEYREDGSVASKGRKVNSTAPIEVFTLDEVVVDLNK
ncbi:DUF4179 domain-containing protein [Salinibacillus xinjiangensis]|uniref:DUF4179 domain-containing protein n=1 Tax=Salinibacillus xinjiangensis TaxID=1229268 RepID=A0A6G1X4V9_9BACI|nr:DUF4179 domain-containing protein [Salinibacillus xinjiangensis]MRG85936.1 DUF4179 domain-containing protein [Salinibacillus xinjiangensis]